MSEFSNSFKLSIIDPRQLDDNECEIWSPVLKRPSYNVTNGNFDYIKDNNTRIILSFGWNAINNLNLWNYMHYPCANYNCSDDIEMDEIKKEMIKLGYNYSEYTFEWTMKQMQYIAEKGEREYFHEIFSHKN